MAATVTFRRGDGISVNANVESPGNSTVQLTAHVIGAANITEAKAALAAYTLPDGTAVINGVDVSACLAYLGGGSMQFIGFQDCTLRVYHGTVVYESTNFEVPSL